MRETVYIPCVHRTGTLEGLRLGGRDWAGGCGPCRLPVLPSPEDSTDSRSKARGPSKSLFTPHSVPCLPNLLLKPNSSPSAPLSNHSANSLPSMWGWFECCWFPARRARVRSPSRAITSMTRKRSTAARHRDGITFTVSGSRYFSPPDKQRVSAKCTIHQETITSSAFRSESCC